MAEESKPKTKTYVVIKGTVQKGFTIPGGEGRLPMQRAEHYREGSEIKLEVGEAEELLALGVIADPAKLKAAAPIAAPANAAPKEGVTITETPKATPRTEPAPAPKDNEE